MDHRHGELRRRPSQSKAEKEKHPPHQGRRFVPVGAEGTATTTTDGDGRPRPENQSRQTGAMADYVFEGERRRV